MLAMMAPAWAGGLPDRGSAGFVEAGTGGGQEQSGLTLGTIVTVY